MFIQNTHNSSSSSVFMCEARLHLHRTLGDGYVKLNADVLFRYRIDIIFTKDLIFKIVCLLYSLHFMESSNTLTYKFSRSLLE